MADIKKLGKYEITGVLGKGGMGTVYQGVDPVIERTVALKTIRKELLEDGQGEGMVERFKNEARAAGRLNHPGIVAIYDYGEDEDVSFIAMEYVAGCGLNEFLREHNKKIPLGDIISIMLQLLAALDYAHEQGVTHRDIKAANLLITSDGKVKITDFGIARLDTSNLTMVGSIIGTPNSMAPEQFMGLLADRRSDVFSAGVVFYEMLTGQRPFVGNMESMASKVCYEVEAPPSSINPELPLAFDAVSAKSLTKLPEDRFQTAHKFSEAIKRAHETTFLSPASMTVSDQTVVLTAQAVQANMAAMRARAERVAASRPGGQQQTSAPATGTQSMITNWHENTLRDVERQLAAHIGPMAKIIVRKAASSTADVHELYTMLANNLDSEGARREFLGGITRLGVTPAPTASGVMAGSAAAGTRVLTNTKLAGNIEPLSQQTIDTASKQLAKYIGPIAGVMVKKAARQATSLQVFYALLADNISNLDERHKFLKEVGPH
ncbi:serine/threonine-protein kinase [Uliginosibacterium sp. H3]|uniref:Serine/threonine-protein kinase n=1 Tax=Uliginosibacterium silvisoli TaxID=3114758 RepID=A0ABU6JZG9_9RHOO|nr:serine/threonine-protein kinase [Uliginosibacterium sp. H3]